MRVPGWIPRVNSADDCPATGRALDALDRVVEPMGVAIAMVLLSPALLALYFSTHIEAAIRRRRR